MTDDREQQLDEIIADFLQAQEDGRTVSEQDVIAAHPELAGELREFFDDLGQMDRMASPLAVPARTRRQVLGKLRYFGDYELLEEIARGGMGIVYKARQTSLNRIVAVKLILSGHLASETDLRRFKTEAESAANLQHPHIVSVHEVGRYEGQSYFSMEFIEGKNLSEIVREHPLPPSQAAGYVRDVAEAIHYAHQQGTLHRDLKPSNVLIDQNDRVQITDFGLAMKVEGDSELTRTGQVLGTPSYMPPEQAQHKRALIGPGSDIYSMGAILYELLTGRPPFQADSPVETLRQVIETEPLSPRLLNPAVPNDLETICLKCLQKEPHKRYATAQHLADDLGRFLQGEPILARPVGRVEWAWRWCRRNPVVAGLSTSLLLALLIGFGSVSYLLYESNRLVQNLNRKNKQLASAKTTIDRLMPLMQDIQNQDYPELLPVFIEGLRDQSPELRQWSAMMLGFMADDADQAVPVLVQALKDREAEVRRAASITLGKIGPEAHAAVPALESIAADRKAVSHEAALISLLQIEPESESRVREIVTIARGLVTRASRDRFPEIHTDRSQLFRQLMRLGIALDVRLTSRVLNAVQPEVHELKQRIVFETAGLGGIVVDELTQILLDHTEPSGVQREALWILAMLGSEARPTAEAIVPFLESSDARLRDMAETALLRVDPERADSLNVRPFDPSLGIAEFNRQRGLREGDWGQLGGSYAHNNTPVAPTLPIDCDVKNGTNIKWKTKLGSQSYGNMVVANGKIFVGTNNGAGFLERYPAGVDLGVLLCLDEETGTILWQYSSPKLPSGRVHDWPFQGICSTPYVEGHRLWFVTNRCEVVCLDVEGFGDGENDGPYREELNENTNEADVIWKFDMMGELGVSPHDTSMCSPTAWGDALFVCTSNGVNHSHANLTSPDAPSFIALNKHTAEVLWSDASPGANILEGQWSSPTVGVFDGTPQVIFPGGDGWLYSFRADRWQDGKPELLWKFDGNHKESNWSEWGDGTRNFTVGPPVIYDGLLYFAMGQCNQSGTGPGMLWCIDPTKRGDVSPTLVINNEGNPAPHRREQALLAILEEREIANPSSAVVWSFEFQDINDDGEIDYEEEMNRATGSPVIRDDLLVIGCTEGIVHCLDAKTGQQHWVHDAWAPIQATPLIADGKLYLVDEDGDLAVFQLGRTKQMLKETYLEDGCGSYLNQVSSRPIVANNVLYIITLSMLYAVEDQSLAPKEHVRAGP